MPFRRHRLSRRIALVALLGLLFQQLAMATYVCPMSSPAAAMAMVTDPSKCHSHQAGDRARCEQHCHPIQTTSADRGAALTVPAAHLPMATWLCETSAVAAARIGPVSCDVDVRAAGPPLTIRHCTFQI